MFSTKISHLMRERAHVARWLVGVALGVCLLLAIAQGPHARERIQLLQLGQRWHGRGRALMRQSAHFFLLPKHYTAVFPPPERVTPDIAFTHPISKYVAAGKPGGSAAPPSTPQPQPAPPSSYRVCPAPGSCFLVPRLQGTLGGAGGARPGAGQAAPQFAGDFSEEDVQQYNTMFGTINIDPKYTFGKEHYIIEGAKRLLAIGSTVYKFQLRAQLADLTNLDIAFRGFLRMIENPLLPYQQLLDMPFKTFIVWAGLLPGPGRPAEYSDLYELDAYKETYDLAVYFLTRYNNTGKTLMIGVWEGDWPLRNDFNRTSPLDAGRVADAIGLLATKQQAVDDAKADTPHSNVFVYNYGEANIIGECMQRPRTACFANKVAPNVRPVLDYMSVSVAGNLIRDLDPSPILHPVLDFVEKYLPQKRGVPGTRVIIGEFGFPLYATNGQQAISAKEQMQRALWVVASCMAWGNPIILWWELYNNEILTINGKQMQRGFWLIDDKGVEQPLFKAMRKFYASAQAFVQSVMAYSGCPPTYYAFRRWAVGELTRLSELPMNLPPPGPVRDRSDADIVPPGVQGAYVTTQCTWKCSNSDCPSVPDNEYSKTTKRGTPWILDNDYYGHVTDGGFGSLGNPPLPKPAAPAPAPAAPKPAAAASVSPKPAPAPAPAAAAVKAPAAAAAAAAVAVAAKPAAAASIPAAQAAAPAAAAAAAVQLVAPSVGQAITAATPVATPMPAAAAALSAAPTAWPAGPPATTSSATAAVNVAAPIAAPAAAVDVVLSAAPAATAQAAPAPPAAAAVTGAVALTAVSASAAPTGVKTAPAMVSSVAVAAPPAAVSDTDSIFITVTPAPGGSAGQLTVSVAHAAPVVSAPAPTVVAARAAPSAAVNLAPAAAPGAVPLAAAQDWMPIQTRVTAARPAAEAAAQPAAQPAAAAQSAAGAAPHPAAEPAAVTAQTTPSSFGPGSALAEAEAQQPVEGASPSAEGSGAASVVAEAGARMDGAGQGQQLQQQPQQASAAAPAPSPVVGTVGQATSWP